MISTISKYCAFLAVLFLLSVPVTGTNYIGDNLPLSLGVKGGVNFANKQGDSSWKTRTAYNFQGFASYQFHSLLFARLGFGYSSKGAVYDVANTEVTRAVGYLYAPLSLGAGFQVMDDLRLNVMLGGYVGYGVSFKSTTKSSGGNKESQSGQEHTHIKKGDVGAVLSVEADYKQFLLGVDYERGFRDVKVGSTINGKEWKNSNIALYVGYRFKL